MRRRSSSSTIWPGSRVRRISLIGFAARRIVGDSNIPFVMLTRDFADKLLAAAGAAVARGARETDRRGPQAAFPRARRLDADRADRRSIARSIETKNVVGVLEGAGPHADETVVIGGHYDHLGHGGLMSGSLAFFSSDIHNGADDNASGTRWCWSWPGVWVLAATPCPAASSSWRFQRRGARAARLAILRRAPALPARIRRS